MPLLAAFTIFATVFVLLVALGGTERVRMRSRLESLRGEPRSADSLPEPRLSVMERILLPVTRAPVQQIKRALPSALLARVQQKLIVAGEPMTLNAFLTFQLISAAGFVLIPVLLIASGGLKVGPMAVIILLALGAGGIMLPHVWLRQRVGQRQGEIIKTLPDAFDLITTCVEAGLGLDAALARVSEKVKGPFADELRRALRDISLGRMRREALHELGDRTGVPDLVSFVNAVIQAEQMGSSVGAVLRVQSIHVGAGALRILQR